MAEKPKRIQLIGAGKHEEGRAGAAIKPGMLLATDADGNWIPHGTAGGPAERAFALEDALQGRTIDTDYATGELVQVGQADPGDTIYGWLAGGESVTPADYLSSNGDGMYKKASGGDTRLAVPKETLDLSDSDMADTRIRVRVL